MAHPVKTVELRQASLVLALGIVLSRLTGLLREILMARWVGAGLITDAFFVAFRIPNTLRNLVAEGGMTAAITPVYSDLLEKPREREAFERRLFTFLHLALLLLTLMGIALAPLWVHAFAAGLPEQGFALAVRSTRWLFPLVYLMGLMGAAMAILQVRGYFFLPATGQVLMNLGLILGTWLYTLPLQPLLANTDALCLGALLGGVLYTGSQLYALWRTGVAQGFEFNLHDPGLKRVLGFMGPATVGFAIYQVSLMLSTQFASFLSTGGVSHLNYADRIVQLPLALIGTAAGSASLSLFSRLRHDQVALRQSFREALLFVTYLAFPSLAFLLLFAEPLVALLYAHGAYPREEMSRTVLGILGYLPGLLFASYQRILLALFFSQMDRRTPIYASLLGLAVQGGMSYLLLPWDTPGVALGSSLGTGVSTAVLFFLLGKKGLRIAPFPKQETLTVLLSTTLASFLGLGILKMHPFSPFLSVLLGVLVMGGSYLLLTLLLKHPEALRLRKRLTQKWASG